MALRSTDIAKESIASEYRWRVIRELSQDYIIHRQLAMFYIPPACVVGALSYSYITGMMMLITISICIYVQYRYRDLAGWYSALPRLGNNSMMAELDARRYAKERDDYLFLKETMDEAHDTVHSWTTKPIVETTPLKQQEDLVRNIDRYRVISKRCIKMISLVFILYVIEWLARQFADLYIEILIKLLLSVL